MISRAAMNTAELERLREAGALRLGSGGIRRRRGRHAGDRVAARRSAGSAGRRSSRTCPPGVSATRHCWVGPRPNARALPARMAVASCAPPRAHRTGRRLRRGGAATRAVREWRRLGARRKQDVCMSAGRRLSRAVGARRWTGGRQPYHPCSRRHRSAGPDDAGDSKLGHLAVSSCEIGLSNVRVPHGDSRPVECWRHYCAPSYAERIAVGPSAPGRHNGCLDWHWNTASSAASSTARSGPSRRSAPARRHETETNAARLMTYQAPGLMDLGRAPSTPRWPRQVCHGACHPVGHACMQVLGEYSYSREFEMEPLLSRGQALRGAGGTTRSSGTSSLTTSASR